MGFVLDMKKRKAGLWLSLLLFIFDYNHIASVSLLLIGLGILHAFDPFELRSDYYLSQDVDKVWGTLDNKWEDGVFGYDFSFVLPDRGMYKGTCYSKFDKFHEQDSVYIEYFPDAPSYSRIIKFDVLLQSKTRFWTGISFALVSLLWLIASLFKCYGRVKLLKEGELKKIRFKSYKSSVWPNTHLDYDNGGFIHKKEYSYTDTHNTKGYTYWSLLWQQPRLMEKEQFILVSEKRNLILNRFPKYLSDLIENKIKE